MYFAPYRYAFQEGQISKKQILEKHPLRVIEVMDDDPSRVLRI